MEKQMNKKELIYPASENKTNRIQCIIKSEYTLDSLNKISEKLNVSRNRILNDAIELALPELERKYNLSGENPAYKPIENNDSLKHEKENSNDRSRKFTLDDMFEELFKKLDKFTNTLEAVKDELLTTEKKVSIIEEKTIFNGENIQIAQKNIQAMNEQNSIMKITVDSIQKMTSYNANLSTLIAKSIYLKNGGTEEEKNRFQSMQKVFATKLMDPFNSMFNRELKEALDKIELRRKMENGEL